MRGVNFLLVALFFFSCKNSPQIDSDKEAARVDSFDRIRTSEVSNDSFMKFTSPIEQRYKGEQAGYGSCFFYKRGNEGLVVTNMHIFTGINYWGGASNEKEDIDTNIVRFDVNDSLVIPIAQYDKEYKNILNLNSDFDLFKIPIKIPNKIRKVNFINDLIDTVFFDKVPVIAFCYGYGGEMFDGPSPDWLHAKSVFVSGNYLSYDDWLKKTSGLDKKDILGLEKSAFGLKNNYFFIANPTMTGMSGSPVFGKFPISNGQNFVIKFIGVLCAGERNAKATWVLKAKYVYNYLQKK